MTTPREGEIQGETLWGGRFASPLHPAIRAFTTSLPFDRRLVRHDLIGSLAHVRMLMEREILDREAARVILEGLSGMLWEVEEGGLRVEGEDEDVHSWIERTLCERVGPAGGGLHTARSRNDQTGTALRLYLREALRDVVLRILALEEVWLARADEHRESWMPGYSHLQRGQPVSLAHHLLAHVWALLADGRRLRAAHGSAGLSPLGAGALAGTSHPIDAARSAALLGFDAMYPNAQLAVADRDYVAEAVFACALVMVHLSRWAEEVVLWATAEFGFLSLEDAVAQGSSLMPQKRNPEAAEILRGKCGRVAGDLATLLVVMKGLPLSYDSDLQEDKEALFDALDTAAGSLRAAAVLAGGIRYRTDRLAAALHEGHLTATELADHLVGRGVPFRTAHEQAGRAVREAEGRGAELWELSREALRASCPEAGDDVLEVLSPEASARARRSPGGPAPERVEEQLAAARKAAEELGSWAEGLEPPPIYRAHQEGRLLEQEVS
ncbi:MAG: argininosuccinate lyase [Gemmatimonadota bacterium]